MAANKNIIIIGAGAAGLMCAITAAKQGANVCLIEHGKKIGAKILISGGGRCNFTNLYATPEKYIGGNKHFHKSALARYAPDDFLAVLKEHEITWHEKTLGQLFCDQKAPRIVEMLWDDLKKYGVEVQLETSVDTIQKKQDRFYLQTSRGEQAADAVVIATGGKSIPKMGATGFAYKIAEAFGLKVNETRPALVPFTATGDDLAFTSGLSGVSLEAIVSCHGTEFRENILFTHRGLSGPAILQISSYWREGTPVEMNILPDIKAEDWLKEMRQSQPKAKLSTILSEVLPKRLALALVARWFADDAVATLNNASLKKVADKLNHWQFLPAGTEGYRTAEVTLGGVSTNDLNSKTMEARAVAGLYFIGECVDVTGWLGGYNFQWAWASGFAAGMAAADK